MDDKFFLSIVDKFNSSAIAELDFNDGNTRLLLRKEGAFKQGSPNTESLPSIQQDHSVHLGISAHTEGKSNGTEKITSPIVATFYSSPGPDAPAFVKPGAKIKAGQTLCILEAMKMMNHLEAEYDCEIMEAHAANGDLVEYGQVLFTVKRN
ncbi:MAG: acetyl-CoA carboxylase biotin carboxyl carrier protein [Treponema sp.]|jgi:acetyl-CoA carboxylase biotin carboxyl carrier protein|nr:acetyl-CoA carboxylase biotin carboxyl carrier protein [Treponema sp.]